jgi:ribosomal protein S27AE
VIGALTVWQTDEPCPGCGTPLVLLDDGTEPIRWECRDCGHGPDSAGETPGGDW